jgi:hypothetical protein
VLHDIQDVCLTAGLDEVVGRTGPERLDPFVREVLRAEDVSSSTCLDGRVLEMSCGQRLTGA